MKVNINLNNEAQKSLYSASKKNHKVHGYIDIIENEVGTTPSFASNLQQMCERV